MKVLFIAPLNSIHSKRWISYFAQRDFEVSVISICKQTVDIDNAEIHIIEPPEPITRKLPFLLYYMFFCRAFEKEVNKVIQSIHPDVIHVHWIDNFACMTVMKKKTPLVLTAWGSDVLIDPRNGISTRWCLKQVLKKADCITCDAEHLKKQMVVYGAAPHKIKIIYFGTNVEDFNPGKKDTNIREELNFEQGTEIIISLRALKPIYDIATFVRAIPRVLKSHENARFVIVGDGSEKEILQKLAKDLGVDSQVRFVGRLSDSDLQRYTASADIYVSTSLSDGGLAASTAESMASKVPVVISDFGNNRDWVEDNENGLLFPLKDFEKLAEKILYLLHNPEIRERFAEKGRNTIESRNNYHKEMAKVSAVYKEFGKN